MSKDIRSFFKPLPKKCGTSSSSEKSTNLDENITESTSESKLNKLKNKKKRILNSDSEDDEIKINLKIQKNPELKRVNISEIFTNEPIKQTKITTKKSTKQTPIKEKKKTNAISPEADVHQDANFIETLLDLDDDLISKNLNELDKKMDETFNKTSTSQKRHHPDYESTITTKKVKKNHIEPIDSGIDLGQESYERKRQSAALYQKYLNRPPPKNLGKKVLPKGKPDCLSGLCFLKTGVLDSLQSEDFNELVKSHGGRTVHSISKKINYVVVGDEPGPSKMGKAKEYNIPIISEDELLDMILIKSGLDAKYKSQIKEEEKIVKSKIIVEKSPKILKKSIIIDSNNLPLTEKYRPTTLDGIIGQQSDCSNMNRLKIWLKTWYDNFKQKKNVTNIFYTKNDTGISNKCALLSGPPGVGKTTTALLVAKELGFDVVELNASDTRNKTCLKEQVGQLLSTNTIAGYALGNTGTDKQRVLIMDEVDGMSGNEDRGGIQELITLIKTTKIPIICMCNDRYHPKIRSLANYCLDLRFTKPKLEQIRGAMMSICFKENIKIPQNILTDLIKETDCDVRQTLNHLSLWMNEQENININKSTTIRKDKIINQWDICRMIFNENEQKSMNLIEKIKLFFYDYSLGPLFVQENYLKVQPNCNNEAEKMWKLSRASDAISMGDLINRKIRSTNNWSLLEIQSIYSSVLPGHYMSGHIMNQIQFPNWLGDNSKRNRMNRLLNELEVHTSAVVSTNRNGMRLDYVYALRDGVTQPLINDGLNGVDKAVNLMKNYHLLREDFDSLMEFGRLGMKKSKEIVGKVKMTFTRNYNKQVLALPFARSSVTKKKLNTEIDDDDDDDDLDDNEIDDKIENDLMIKLKKSNKNMKDESKKRKKMKK